MEIVIYILFYHYFITSSFHPYPSLLYSSTILLSYPYPFPLSYPLIYQPLFYHILFTFTPHLSPFYPTTLSFYTFKDIYPMKVYYISILYFPYHTYSPSYTYLYSLLLLYTSLTYIPPPPVYRILIYTDIHTHTDIYTHTHRQTHRQTHTLHILMKIHLFLYILYISITYYFTYIPNTLPKQTKQ